MPDVEPPVYTFLGCDLLTDEIIYELPMSECKWGKSLGGTGDFSGSVALGAPEYDDAEIIAATETNKTSLYIDRDGQIVWAGQIWGRKYDSESGKFNINAVEFFSYFTKRFLRVNSKTLFAIENVDQFDIMRAFVNYVQSESGGNLGIVMDATDSGVLRDREWKGFERKEIAEAMSQLSEVRNGFDFEIGGRYNTFGVPEKFLGLYYPRRGRPSLTSELVFDYPGTIRKYEFDEDGTKQAVRTDAIGEGEGPDMKIETWMESHLLDEGYPLLDQVVDYKDVKRRPTLLSHARGDGELRQYPATTLTLKVDSLTYPQFGDWTLGDNAVIQIEDKRFPGGVVMDRRIMGWEMEQATTIMSIDTEEIQYAPE